MTELHSALVEPARIEPRSHVSRPTVIALLAAALAFLAFILSPRLPAVLDRIFPARVAARAIGKALQKRADTVGPVAVSGTELRLFKGAVRLVVSQPDE